MGGRGGRRGGARTWGPLRPEQLGSEDAQSVRGDLLEEVTAELEHAQIWSQSLPGSRACECKGLEAGTSPT